MGPGVKKNTRARNMLYNYCQKKNNIEYCTYLTVNPCVPESVSVDVGGGNQFAPLYMSEGFVWSSSLLVEG